MIVDYWGLMVSGQPVPATDVIDARLVKLSRLKEWGITSEVEETILMAEEMRIASTSQ